MRPQGSRRISVRAGTFNDVQLRDFFELDFEACRAGVLGVRADYFIRSSAGSRWEKISSGAVAQTAGSKNPGGAVSLGSNKAAAEAASAANKNAASGGGECFRAAIGSEVPEPEDLRSVDGVLKVDLAFRSFVDSKGEVRFCYVTPNGKQSPTLRVKPGDTVILNFKNEATATPRPSRTVAANGQLGAAMSTPGGARPRPYNVRTGRSSEQIDD